MPIDVPPWVLAPEFSWQTYRFLAVGSPRKFLPVNTRRVALAVSSQISTLPISPSQQGITSGGQLIIPVAASPFLIHFSQYGGLVCSEWWDNGNIQFDCIEIMWTPTAKGRK